MAALPEVQPPFVLSITVKFGNHPSEAPEAVAHVAFDEGAGLTPEQIGAELLALAESYDPLNRFDLDIKYAHYFWGADASAAEIVMYLANLAAGATAGAVVQHVFKRIVKNSNSKVDRIGRKQAIQQARQRVAVSYEESAERLRVTEEVEKKAGTSWEIRLVSDQTGDDFVVTVERLKKRAITTTVSRFITVEL